MFHEFPTADSVLHRNVTVSAPASNCNQLVSCENCKLCLVWLDESVLKEVSGFFLVIGQEEL